MSPKSKRATAEAISYIGVALLVLERILDRMG